MYKRAVSIFALLVLLLSLCAYAETVDDQRTADVINKIMQTAKKDIAEDVNRNVDANFQELDNRMMAKQQDLFRKAIFALMGAFTVVLFGYAFVISRVTRHYDFNFYEKMMDSKVDKLRSFSTRHIVATSESFYIPVTHSQFSKQYTSSEAYFDKHFSAQEGVVAEKDAKIDELQKKVDSMSGTVKSDSFYASPMSQAIPQKMPSKWKRYLINVVVGVLVLAIIALLIIFAKGRGWLNFNFLSMLKGGK
jgi:hypothetical protein